MTATLNVSKVLAGVVVGAPTASVGVTKVVAYAIVNTDTPPSPPPPRRRQACSIVYGKTRAIP